MRAQRDRLASLLRLGKMQGRVFSSFAQRVDNRRYRPFPDAPDKVWISPDIVGCVTYKTLVDEPIHHTWFAIEFRKKDPITGTATHILSSDQTIASDQWVTRFSLQGRNDAD
jgi:hypothetical protein